MRNIMKKIKPLVDTYSAQPNEPSFSSALPTPGRIGKLYRNCKNRWTAFIVKDEFEDFNYKTIKEDLVKVYNSVAKGDYTNNATPPFASFLKQYKFPINGPIKPNETKMLYFISHYESFSVLNPHGVAQVHLEVKANQYKRNVVFERQFEVRCRTKWLLSDIKKNN
jgi:hypothetical protein